MPELGWAALGGNELVNTSRAAAYAHGVNVICTCDTLPDALGDDLYRSPAEDPAPWYQRTVPESAEFWGVVGLEIHGASQSTLTRTFTDLASDGAIAGTTHRAARELEFKVLLLAGTEPGLSYGISWLSSALRGSACHSGCEGDTLCLLAGCPAPPPQRGDDPCRPKPPHEWEPDGEWDAYQAGEDLLRTIYDVALSEFASDETRQRAGGAWTCQLTFTLKAGQPYWFTAPVTLLDSRHPERYPPPVVQDVLHAYRIDQPVTCPEPADCLAGSPYLADRGPWGDEPFPGSDPRDPHWRDPGWPTAPFDAQRAVYTSPADITPGWFERVPIVSLYSGRTDLHRITVRFYENPRNKPVTGDLDPCDAVTEITLPWVPARTRVTLDGRTRSVEVKCRNGNVLTSDVTLYGRMGKLLEWPVFDCGLPMAVELLAQVGTLAPDMWYRFAWAGRMDAI